MNAKKAWYTIRLLLCRDGYERAEYIKKHDIFGSMGNNCYFHPYWVPGDSKNIFIHDNVKIASNVTFICHDIANAMLNTKYNTKDFKYYLGSIEIFDNVFIGTNTTILPNKKIGPNCIVGGGTVVSKDVTEGTVVAGNPMRIIESFDDFVKRRKEFISNSI
jgi:acetyltransferase-like isoleucine patch superfamily enzyme